MKRKLLLSLFLIFVVTVFVVVMFSRNEKILYKNTSSANTDSTADNIKDELSNTNDYAEEFSVYNNPIDEYYLPKIYSWEVSEAEIRELQDAYKKAWKEEFENLMKYLRQKCIYKEDKKNIKLLEKSVLDNIEKSQNVIVTELLDVYQVNPEPSETEDTISRYSYWGNGTRSRLEQIEGEIYRDACMRIINLYGEERKYEFSNADFEKKLK